MADLTASGIYGFGQNPEASVNGQPPLSSYTGNQGMMLQGGLGTHFNHPLFWLLVIGLILLGIFSFAFKFGIKRVGSVGVKVR